MSNFQDYKDSIKKWAEMWDEIGGSFDKCKDEEEARVMNEDVYWAFVLGENYIFEEENNNKEQKTTNPVYPDSVGKDQEKPKPAWVREDFVQELTELKNKLFNLENELARIDWESNNYVDSNKKLKMRSDVKKNNKYHKLTKKIKSIKKKIDKLSDMVGIEKEKTPWVVENDEDD